MKNSTTNQIIKASKKSGKSYHFNEEHDENVPGQTWFQESDEGLILFIVFYSQACRWSRCLGCNLPSKGSKFHVGYRALIAQTDYVFTDPKVVKQKERIRKVIVSNNGSVLDQETFSSTALMYLMAQLNLNFPNLSVLSIETRPEYVEVAELEFLSRALKEGDTPTELELAIGFEAFDEKIRNDVFNKGLRLEVFENCVKNIALYKYRMKCYFMQKPIPRISDEEAVQDIKNAIDYLSNIAKEHDISINMHLNPTYVAFGTFLEESFNKGEYSPPKLTDVAKAVLHAKGKNLSVFIGLYDEGLAADGGSFIRPGDEKLVEKFEKFNRSQDFNILC